MKVYNYSGDYAYQQRKMREEKEALSKKNVEKPQVVEQKTESNVENKVSGRGETRRKAKPFLKTASKETLFRRGDAIASATNNRCSVALLLTNPISSTKSDRVEPENQV